MTNVNTLQQPINNMSWWKTLLVATVTGLVFNLISLLGTGSTKSFDFLQSTDDVVRMTMVRDWMAGQGWFDPYLHQLGYEPGTVMHWSRLIDAPIRLLVELGNMVSAGSGEYFSAIAWPLSMFVAAFCAILHAVQRTTGSNNLIPSFIVGGFALWSWGVFHSGAIDHHNAQVALGLWLVVCVIPSQNDRRNLTAAGIITALSLAIGMEALPISIAGAIAVCFRLYVEREAFYAAAQRYGRSLAIAIIALFFLLVGPQAYTKTYCDSLSLFHIVGAGVGGFMLYGGLHPLVRRFMPAAYILVPAFAGGAVLAITIVWFPQCLGDPVAIDPLMKHFWLDYIVEAQNIFQIAKSDDPYQIIYIYAVLLVAAGVSIWKIFNKNEPILSAVFLIFLIVTSAVVLFQVRGIKQALPIAALVLSIETTRFMERKGKEKPLLGFAALLASCNIFWIIATVAIEELVGNAPAALTAQEKKVGDLCTSPTDLATINAEKPGFIATNNGLGPWLLFNTKHRVLAGPYHRNTEGNLDSIKIMIGTQQEAEMIVKKGGFTLFMACPKFPDEVQILKEVPNGFLGQLLAGKTPAWLEPIAATMDRDLKIWRVVSTN